MKKIALLTIIATFAAMHFGWMPSLGMASFHCSWGFIIIVLSISYLIFGKSK